MPLTKKMQQRLAEELGRAVAKSHYEMFLQDKFRGPQFKWEHLPDIAERWAEISLPTSMPHQSRFIEELVDLARKTAYSEALRLITEGGKV